MYYAKRNKSIRQRQIPYDFTHMWNLRNKTDEHRGRGKKGEREGNHKRLLTIENKLRVTGGEESGEWAKWVMGTKEGTCDEHWILYVSDESLNSTHKTIITLYVNLDLFIY